MRLRKKRNFKLTRERAIEICSNHNAVPIEVAEKYTDSEIRETLKNFFGFNIKFPDED